MKIKKSDLQNPAFMEGMKLAIQDKKKSVTRDLSNVSSKNFKAGYLKVMEETQPHSDHWWDLLNSKLTSFLADIGTTFFQKK